MNFRSKKMLQTVTLFLVICLSNLYIFAGISDNPTQPEDVLIAGVLIVFDAQSVKVNGNAAQDGMTILSGAEITTNKNSKAVINLPQLGKVELNSETSVKLVFMAEHVELQVFGGQAKLTTYKGIIGFLTDTDGKFLKTDPKLDVSSVASGEYTNDEVPLPVPAIASPGLFGMGAWGTFASIGGVIGGSVAALGAFSGSSNDTDNPVSRVRP